MANRSVFEASKNSNLPSVSCSAVPTQPAPSTAEVYDPASNAFTPTGTMHAGRAGHTATLLARGRLLVVGSGAEVYDPTTRSFSVTAGAPGVDRRSATATLLGDGRVLLAGGEASGIGGPLASTELYAPPASSGIARSAGGED